MRSIPTKEHIHVEASHQTSAAGRVLSHSAGTPAASTPKDLPSVVVKYGDLNLNTKTGVATPACAHLRNAAKQVCSPLDSRVLGLREQYEQCVSDAVTQSVAAVGNDGPDPLSPLRWPVRGRDGVVASRLSGLRK